MWVNAELHVSIYPHILYQDYCTKQLNKITSTKKEDLP